MYKIFSDIEEFKKEVEKLDLKLDIDIILSLDLIFFNEYEKFIIINIRDYGENPNNFLILSKDKNLVYSSKFINGRIFSENKQILSKPYAESTLLLLSMLKSVLVNYNSEFEKIKSEINLVDENLNINKVEDLGRRLRKLTDRLEDLVELIIKLKERHIKEFNTELIDYDYDVLVAESKYWLERCRSHLYHISGLRTKCDMKSTSELNETMRKLTVIMTFLMIVNIIVNVPGTVGAIFGIPALSDEYFKYRPHFLVWSLIILTVLSIYLGWIYWKKLKLRA